MSTSSAITLESTRSIAARTLIVYDLGTISYLECWGKQRELVSAITSGQAPDTLLLLEHPHTYTCGRSGGRNHILASEDELAALGASVLDVDRGGNVTYHGPGQLVAYPVINLFASPMGRDYRAYLRALEQVLMNTLADFAISSCRLEGFSGLWVAQNSNYSKVAAIGVKVDGRGITSHGIALNVSSDLSYFDKIIPCGIADKGVTSMTELLMDAPVMSQVKSSVARHFRDLFGFN